MTYRFRSARWVIAALAKTSARMCYSTSDYPFIYILLRCHNTGTTSVRVYNSESGFSTTQTGLQHCHQNNVLYSNLSIFTKLVHASSSCFLFVWLILFFLFVFVIRYF